MRILGKKIAIALLSVSMALVPSLNANAQQGGTVLGMSTATAAVVGVIAVAAIAYNVDSNDDSERFIPPADEDSSTTTTTDTSSGGGSTTTTTTN
ncbi:MAG: hypothetical protein CMQ38_12025 [Gammaproteobacteria bacterium]|nr:hypothetical protein [Gammaproteobacteria bacterium]